MSLYEGHEQTLQSLFHLVRLHGGAPESDRSNKIQQILAYLEVIDAQVRRLSSKRELMFVENGSGNSYLSFLVYHYYAKVLGRNVTIHCIDHNERLMAKSKQVAQRLGFDRMRFHAADILDAPRIGQPDIAYSLHACDTATDKALFVGLKLRANCILSVACCQHTAKRRFTNRAVKGVTRYKAFKDRLVYMVADTMRAHLIAARGYKVDVFEFTSSRHTDKNVMIRARKSGQRGGAQLFEEYQRLRSGFNVEPELAQLLRDRPMST